MPRKMIDQVDVSDQRVLIRVDFNVPLGFEGTITDDSRIRAALPTIQSVISRGGKAVLMSHLGRPERDGPDPATSLAPMAARLGELLEGVQVTFPDTDCLSTASAEAVDGMSNGDVVVLENLRHHAGERAGDSSFAAKLARYGDIYCNDAFGTAHRDDASMVAVPSAMEGKPRVSGLLLQRELDFFAEAVDDPAKPLVAVLGGAKVSDKLGVLDNLMNRADTILVGGAMAYTFLKALGHEVGKSLVQLGMLDDARNILDHAAASHTDLILPVDHVCGKEMTHMTPVHVFSENIEEGWMGLDIGPETSSLYAQRIGEARTVVWNGPMGVAEIPPFDVGTRQIAEAIARATGNGAVSVVGGGDTAGAVSGFGMMDRFSHVSTGGGASLHLLEGKAFNSVESLDEA